MAEQTITPWVGVDLDGTLAHYDGEWKGIEHIGDPIPLMVDRVKKAIADGKVVKIFTARAATPEAIPHVQKWLVEKAGLPDLEVTNAKNWGLEEIWDDLAKQVIPNTGKFLEDSLMDALDEIGRD